ncbi:MAG TPA: septum site-determining protein MinC [Ktedonobacteraceae bacterium]|nr:septum site-determining protein MinC [Ktedonobacteraceae bacterium]
MGMEDTSEGNISEAQSNLEREEKQSVQGNIAIKGTRNGLLLTLEPETPFSELLNALSYRLSEAPGFFRGASLALDTRRRNLRMSERSQLEELLANYQMSVTSLEQALVAKQHEQEVISSDVGSESSIDVGSEPSSIDVTIEPSITAELPSDQTLEQVSRLDPRDSDDTLFLRRTIRSGQAIQHASSIVILGDVNPGAEIVARGDIIVWGVLRGMVHAGYPNNENAIVCSLLLAPVQLRIAHLLSRPPDGFQVQARPEFATIKNGQIVVEAWLNGHGRTTRK